jgi:hypothetical protein
VPVAIVPQAIVAITIVAVAIASVATLDRRLSPRPLGPWLITARAAGIARLAIAAAASAAATPARSSGTLFARLARRRRGSPIVRIFGRVVVMFVGHFVDGRRINVPDFRIA